MRVLLVGGRLRGRVAGAAVATHGLARALRDRGDEVTLLHAAAPSSDLGVRGVEMRYERTLHRGLYPLRHAVRSSRGFDVVHANDEAGGPFAVRARAFSLPLVAQLQPPYVDDKPLHKTGWRWRYIRLAATHAPALLTPSRWIADALSERFSVERSRFHVVPYGVGDHWFDAYESSAPREEARPRVVLVNMKAVDVALKAFARANLPADAVIDLVGSSKREPEYSRLAQDLGIADRVRFLGFVRNEKLPEHLKGARVLLHPAQAESFGQVLAEAAAAGVPALAARAHAVPEVVHDGTSGVLCPVDDVDAFAAELARIVHHPKLQHRLREGARERALQRWRWDRIAAQLHDEVYAPLRARTYGSNGQRRRSDPSDGVESLSSGQDSS